MAADGRAETCSWDIWLKIHYNNCFIESCVRLYILYFCIFIVLSVDVSSENPVNLIFIEFILPQNMFNIILI